MEVVKLGTPKRMLLCALAAFAIKVVLFIHCYVKARRQFPGPPVANIWSGNLSETMKEDVHERWRRWHREFGPVYQTWNGLFSRVIYVGDPWLIKKIANESWPKFPAQYAGFKPLSGSALFAQMDQERWKMQRNGLAPAFQPRTVNDQYPALRSYLLQFVDDLDTAAKQNTVVDLSTLHTLLTLDFIGEIFRDVLPELMKCGMFPLRAKIPILKSTRVMHRAIDELRAMGLNAVENARALNDMGEKGVDLEASKKIFEILAQQRGPDGKYMFSADELVDNYVTFLVAGGDPTAHTMTFAVNEILRNPPVLAKLLCEIDTELPADCIVPTIEQVSRLRYLHLIIKETLRYNGPGFGTFRYTPMDVEIEGVMLPKNTTLALWNPQVHRDPNVWGDDADVFRPERWLAEPDDVSSGEKRAAPGSYFPFSYGPRKCMGEGLAMLEMSLTLATLFKRYDLSFQPGFEMVFQPSFTLCSRNGLPVYARLRK